MRLFTAIDIPTDVKDHILALLNRLRPLAKISWSPVENLHITTKFIGEWPDPRLDEIKRALSAVSPAAAFDIEVRGLGWFPNPRHPRVFWVGVDGGQPLRALAHATEQAVAALGVPVEQRPYSPHLTLARIKDRVALEPGISQLRPLPARTSRAALSARERCCHTPGNRHNFPADLMSRVIALLQLRQCCQDRGLGYPLHDFEPFRTVEHERQAAPSHLLVASHHGREGHKICPGR